MLNKAPSSIRRNAQRCPNVAPEKGTLAAIRDSVGVLFAVLALGWIQGLAGAEIPNPVTPPNLTIPQVPGPLSGFGDLQGKDKEMPGGLPRGGAPADPLVETGSVTTESAESNEQIPASTPVSPSDPAPAGDFGMPGDSAPNRGNKGGILGVFGNLLGAQKGQASTMPNIEGLPNMPNIPGMMNLGSKEEGVEPENLETQRKAKELTRLAIQNIEKNRISESKKNLNDLITLKPYEAEYHLALGLCFRKENRHREAVKKYQDVLDLGGPKSLVNLLRAEVAAKEGDKEKAFEFLKEAAVGGRNIIHDVQNLRLLEKYKTDTEFIKLALALEKFEVLSRRNQDPFTNPFPASQATGGPKEPMPGPLTLSPKEQQDLLNDARRTYDKVQWYIKLEDEEKAMENYIQLRDIIQKKDLITLPKIANDFRILMSRMETLETQIEGIRLKYYWNQAQDRLRELKDAFLTTEYARVDQVYGEIEKLSKEMESANIRFKPVADRILASARIWLNRSKVRREFQAAKPEVQGVVIAEDVKLAIIDNRIRKQGERFGEFHLQKIENNRVTFRYKGEEIPLIFRRY